MFPDLNQYSLPLLILVIQGLVFATLLLDKYVRLRNPSDLFLGLILILTCYFQTCYTVGFMGWYDEYRNTKIKNNSNDRHNFEVVGPKPEGGKFGYGFPMNPYHVREENWTTGTKIYKINGLGLRKLIRVIEPEDEGKTIELFI